jgi:ectoine hydroxylase-related dioxygenase (phytanoyl-CoA dioxygenase family)
MSEPIPAAGLPQRAVPDGFDAAPHLARIEAQGFTILEDFLDAEGLARFRQALAPWLGLYRGRNPFEGLATERVYTLVGRGAIFEDIAAEPRVLAILDRLLLPNYLLSADHAICIHPGEAAQDVHHDDSFYPWPRPRPAISIAVIGAIDEFTAENGATVLYPGSHRWPLERCVALRGALAAGERTDDTESAVALTMKPGAIGIFPGTLMHGAGTNRSNAPRLAFTNQYCEPWARTQENFYLGVPKEKVRRMRPELQVLLGYELRRPGDIMGQVGGYHPAKALDPDWVPPSQRMGLGEGRGDGQH